jgi:hypothetical protein
MAAGSLTVSGHLAIPGQTIAAKTHRKSGKGGKPPASAARHNVHSQTSGEEIMGLRDHRRDWHYEVSAPPADCIRAFTAAFKGKGGLVVKASWSVRTTAQSATATYEGRKGLGAVGAALNKTSGQEADTAIGSQVAFIIQGSDGGRTRCSMSLASSGRSGIAGLLGATSDARFIRPYMQAVGTELLKLDPNALIQAN